MPVAPADRILEVVAEPIALGIVRTLATSDQTQTELVRNLKLGQSVVSRAAKALRAAGVIESDTPRSALKLRTPVEMRLLLAAADRVAEGLLAEDTERQRTISEQTRRTLIRPAGDAQRTKPS